jgi:hypothetical protein
MRQVDYIIKCYSYKTFNAKGFAMREVALCS